MVLARVMCRVRGDIMQLGEHHRIAHLSNQPASLVE